MQTTDKSNRSLSSGDSTEKTLEASYMLAQHVPICKAIGVDHEVLRARVLECLKESGVRRKRMVNDLIEDFKSRASKLN